MSLYLKYRPKDFDNLVGQDFIKNTLKKAITENKTVGAYLFCGPRGTGKTSTARLFAKSINCINTNNGNPCLECDICKDFHDDKLVDIIEIDAASHTGVDNIREIIERAQFTPTKTKYKIYIIDEVHMLSKGAFNALLKILEEPPKHVKFILATTETHKVPETIISRCQRYDFKRINDLDLVNRLKHISEKENIEVDEESYNYILKNSNGGLRNAISLYEQLISDNKISFENIVENLEIIPEERIANFLNKLLNKDSNIINDLEEIIGEGKNIKLFFKELLFYTKNKSITEIKAGNNISDLIYILDILDETYTKTKSSIDENTTFTIGILKILNGNTIIQNQISDNIQKTSIQTTEAVKEIKPKVNTKKEEIKHDDITDIFGGDDVFGADNSDNISDSELSSANFNSSEFISKLKTSGAKGALTMTLRGCNLSLSSNCLNIKASTKMAQKTASDVDNISLMSKVLNELGFGDYKINVK